MTNLTCPSILFFVLLVIHNIPSRHSFPQEPTTTFPASDDVTTVVPEVPEDLLHPSQSPSLQEKLDERIYAYFGKPREVYPVNQSLGGYDTFFDTRIINSGSGGNKIDVLTGTKQCKCGYKVTPSVIGGTNANVLNYSWTAAIIDADSHKLFCGGSLITDRHILTASHCVQSYRRAPEDIYIVLKEEKISPETLSQSKRKSLLKAFVKEIIMHEKYNPFTIDNDIAIITLKEPLRIYSQSVVPACIPASNDNDFAGLDATIVGWGSQEESNPEPTTVLQKVQVPIMTNYDCITKTDTHHYAGKVNDNMMCAGHLEGQMDACQGDSGGPLTIFSGDVQVQVGVVSWGVGCARPRSPGVYTRVGRYIDWIKSKTVGGNMCNNFLSE